MARRMLGLTQPQGSKLANPCGCRHAVAGEVVIDDVLRAQTGQGTVGLADAGCIGSRVLSRGCAAGDHAEGKEREAGDGRGGAAKLCCDLNMSVLRV